MLVGHVVAPYGAAYGAGVSPARLALFAAVMLLLGAWRGRAEWRTYAEWNGRPPQAARERIAAALGAFLALAAAAAGYGVAHG